MFLLLRWLSSWPLWALHGLGALAGWLTWCASPTYRRRFRAFAQAAGLPWSQVRPAIAHAGRMAGELPWMWLRPVSQPLASVARWQGVEHVEAAHAKGRGLVLLTPHIGSFEATAQFYAECFAQQQGPITVLYRPARSALMRRVVEASRGRPGLATAPASLAGVRQMIRALRQGQTVGLLPDQVPPEGLGVWAPFFGRPAYTMTLAARLVQQTGATVLLIWGERLPRGKGFVIHLQPGPDIPADATPESAAALINQAMESVILQAPGQYLWGYHRYKQPRGLDIAAAPKESP